MKKWYALGCILLLALVGCRRPPAKFVVGVSQCSNDSWRAKLNEELRREAQLYDDVEVRIASAADDNATQIRHIEGFLRDKVDLLIVAPNEAGALTPVLNKAYDRGIPVVLVDRRTASDKYTAFIGADNEAIGRAAGEYVRSRLQRGARVLEIQGLHGSTPALERHRGFTRALAASGIAVTDGGHADWFERRAERLTDSLLQAGERYDLVFAQCDRMAFGARKALLRHGQGHTLLVGIDALPSTDGGIAAVNQGRLTATFIYPTRGDEVMRLAHNILTGRPYQKENVLYTGIVDASNARTLLHQSSEVEVLDAQLDTLHGRIDAFLLQYNQQKIILALSVAFIALLLLSIVLLYKAYRTQQHLRQQVEDKNRLIEETTQEKLTFFTNVSHDFRTPLTLIADPVEQMVEDKNLTRQQRDLLRIVRKNTHVLMRLVGEILDFRKIQNGKMALNVADFDLADCLRQWLDVFSAAAEKRKVTLALDAPPALDVRADLYKVERICYNLLSNALKYSAAGGSITLAARGDEAEVVISVTDTGAGIPAEKLPYLFDRFYQAEGVLKDGAGIGLAIVKAFAELHGGTVAATSRLGEGTTLTVRLPRHQAETTGETGDLTLHIEEGWAETPLDALGTQALTDKLTTADPQAPRRTVLIIDDNDELRAYVLSLLSTDYEVLQAADGQAGLHKALHEKPDLIICDVRMPVMNGLDFCRTVKADASTGHIPVLLLTAQTLEGQRAEGYDCGADAYLIKPFSGAVLKARVHNLLENRRRMRTALTDDAPHREEKSADAAFLDRFRELVQEHLADSTLNIDFLSARLGLSRSQLYRKISALTNSSPADLIRETRLRRAERLLATTDKTIAEISYLVGFSSPSHFTKCYRELFGKTPKARSH